MDLSLLSRDLGDREREERTLSAALACDGYLAGQIRATDRQSCLAVMMLDHVLDSVRQKLAALVQSACLFCFCA
jgi:hypothetical protein